MQEKKRNLKLPAFKKFVTRVYKTGDIVAYSKILESPGRTYGARILHNTLNYPSEFKMKNLTPRTEYGTFFTPNTLQSDDRTEKNVKDFTCIYIDIDEGVLPEFEIQPHFVFARDEGHFHVYWVIDRIANTPDTLIKYKHALARTIEEYGGDEACKDACRLLRVPETGYYKGKKPGPGYALITDNSGLPNYELQDFLPEQTKEEKKAEEKSTKRAVIYTNGVDVGAFIVKTYKDRGIVYAGEGRSLTLYHIGLDCFAWGLELSVAKEVARSINEKLFSPSEDDKVLRHQIESAYKYHKGAFGENSTEAQDATDKARKKLYKRFSESVRVRAMLEGFVYITQAERLIQLSTGMELTTKEQINNYIAHHCESDFDVRALMRCRLVNVVDCMDFRPDIEERFYKNRGRTFYNRYQAKEIEPKKNQKAVDMFISHLKYLSNDDKEFNQLLNFLAWPLQNPGHKLPYAMLIISRLHGVGKSFLERLMKKFCTHGYVDSIANEQLNSDFTHYLADKQFLFVHELAQGDRYSILNHLKHLITEPTVEVNGKFERPYKIRNCVNFIFFSNRLDAAPLDKYDRRFSVIYLDKPLKDTKYYNKLFGLLEAGAWPAVYGYLMGLDLKDFKPYDRPELTSGKQRVIEQGKSELHLFLDEGLFKGESPFDSLALQLSDILNYCELHGPAMVRYKTSSKSVQRWLTDHRYNVQSIHKRLPDGKRVHLRLWLPDGINVKQRDQAIDQKIIAMFDDRLDEIKI